MELDRSVVLVPYICLDCYKWDTCKDVLVVKGTCCSKFKCY